MITVTKEEMRAIDSYAIKNLEIPSLILMENAALRTIDTIDLNLRQTFAVFCGMGNNGGDGLAIARGLLCLGKKVIVYLVGDKAHATEEFRTNFRALEHLTQDIHQVETLGDIGDMIGRFGEVNTFIDCIFGTGLDREIRGVHTVVMEQMNEARTYTISVDMPSGIDATSGKVWGSYVHADEVVCFEYMKKGLKANPYVNATIRVVPIGIPAEAKKHVLGDRWESREDENVGY